MRVHRENLDREEKVPGWRRFAEQYRSTVVSRSLLMLVIATFRFDPAELAMNWVRASGISIVRGDTPARSTAAS